jgi:Fe-S-cluster-containing dehydrogenase component
MHCQEAWCLDVCPAGAIVRDDTTNAVIIQAEKCAGCKMCILACPYGNIHFDAASSVSRKCDLCQGNPRCVGHCIAAALNYEEAEDYSARIRKRFDYHLAGIINAGRH